MKNNLYINIKKPMPGTDDYVSVNENLLLKAIKLGMGLEIEVPAGKAVVDPAEWIAKGRREERVFLRPNEPMILYYGRVPLKRDETTKRKVTTTKVTTIVIEEQQTKLF